MPSLTPAKIAAVLCVKQLTTTRKSHFQAQVSDFYEFFGKVEVGSQPILGCFSHAEKQFFGITVITVEDEYPNRVVWKESHSAPVSSARQNVAMTSITAFEFKIVIIPHGCDWKIVVIDMLHANHTVREAGKRSALHQCSLKRQQKKLAAVPLLLSGSSAGSSTRK